MSKKHNVIFLNRSYNDMDIQSSLVEEFAKDPNYNVRVIGYIADGQIGQPSAHEAAAFLQNKYKTLSFETVLDTNSSPLILRFLGKIYEYALKQNQQKKQGAFLFEPVRRVYEFLLKKPQPWLRNMAESWQADIIIMDEIAAQSGRSYFVDVVLPDLAAQGTKIYMILTGHNVYPKINDDVSKQANYKKSVTQLYCVPSQLDLEISEESFPHEDVKVMGNLRMDRTWIEKLHKEILRDTIKSSLEKLKPLENRPIKIVLMLSKISYGVDTAPLIETIQKLGAMDNVALAIKPHTRGMKFDFMSDDQLGDAIVCEDIPSTALLEWSDIILFTGSSIVFHGMVLGKAVGLLDYCKTIETIFDSGKLCEVFQSVEQLEGYIQAFDPETAVSESAKDWIVQNLHNGDADGHVVRHYKNLICEDYKIQKS